MEKFLSRLEKFANQAEAFWSHVAFLLSRPNIWTIILWPTWLRRLWLFTMPVAVMVQVICTLVLGIARFLWWAGGMAIMLFVCVVFGLPALACFGVYRGVTYVWKGHHG